MLKCKAYIGEAHYLRSYGTIPENPLKNEKYKKVKKTSRKFRPEDEWIKIPVPAIIDKDLFYRVNKIIADNFTLCQRNKKNEYLLSGKIYCGCGRRRTGEGPMHGKHLYYRCTDRVYSYPLPSKCKEKGLNARIADSMVWEKIRKIMSSPDLIMNYAKEWTEKSKEEQSTVNKFDNSALKKEIVKLKKEEDRYLRAYGASVITMEKLKEYMNDLKNKKSITEQRISCFEQSERVDRAKKSNLPSDEELMEFCQKAQTMLNCLSFDAKQRIIRETVEKITSNQQELLVEGYLPVANNNKYVEFSTINRNSRFAKCR